MSDERVRDRDEMRWLVVAAASSHLRKIARFAVKLGIPKHVVVEVFSDEYDEARYNARAPQ